MLIAILADTHLPRGRRRLSDACVEHVRRAGLVVHAGDFMTREAFDEIAGIGPPLAAVHGNVDSPELRRLLPETTVVEAAGSRLGLVHDAGPAKGRLARLRRRFPGADAVLFGHSHLPLHEEADGFQIFNPGSPTERRRAPTRSRGMARVEAGGIRFELIELP
jgi:uncharacterized protein